MTQDELERQAESLHYHAIDWDSKYTPIRRRDLSWLPKGIIESEDIEFFQIAISTGTGRIVGYWGNAESGATTFFVVLFDPEHNIQPSQKHNYQIRPTTVSKTQYDALKERVDRALLDKTCTQKCELRNILNRSNEEDYILYTKLDRQLEAELSTLLEEHSLADLLEFGILYAMEKLDARNESPERISHLISLLRAIQDGNHPLT